jgi:preprotein translocase subunit SecA
MAFTTEQKVQRELNFAIIDEVDSILIDEARTPLIISGAADDYSEIYQAINHMIPSFTKQTESGEGKEVVVEEAGDYTVDEKHQQVFLTDDGHTKAENLLIEAGVLPEGVSLYDASNILLMQHINSALRAHVLFHKDDNYIVDGDEVVIVDEFTGRTMLGRRWSEGLHQAIEAKEGVSIKNENQTLASITFQNYFRLYNKLSGMTGTADTEAVEFQAIYNLETVVVPPNRPSTRNDMSDKIYLTLDEKLEAIAQDVEGCQKTGQPVLVGTSSIENSEAISALLTQKKVKHYPIVASSPPFFHWQKYALNCLLKIDKSVLNPHHLDDQNDPATDYLHHEIQYAIEHKMVNRAIENAQKKVEEMNYTARKNLLE